MTRADRRSTPANDRVAASHLRGEVTAPHYVDGWAAQVGVPLVDLCDAPDGARDRQVPLGRNVTVYDRWMGWCFVQVDRDGYVGYVPEAALTRPRRTTHRVGQRATHVYARPDAKAPARMALPIGAELAVRGRDAAFFVTDQGYVPGDHLWPLDTPETDPVAVAERLLGTPYLWGGNGPAGVDCSGLVQIGCQACALPCPADSDQQARALGQPLPEGAAPRRGDLVFWPGHVAWVSAPDRLLHATAHRMAVIEEPLNPALDRIAQATNSAARFARLEI